MTRPAAPSGARGTTSQQRCHAPDNASALSNNQSRQLEATRHHCSAAAHRPQHAGQQLPCSILSVGHEAKYHCGKSEAYGLAASPVRSEQWSYIAGAGHASLQMRWAQMSCRLWHCLVALPEGSLFE